MVERETLGTRQIVKSWTFPLRPRAHGDGSQVKPRLLRSRLTVDVVIEAGAVARLKVVEGHAEPGSVVFVHGHGMYEVVAVAARAFAWGAEEGTTFLIVRSAERSSTTPAHVAAAVAAVRDLLDLPTVARFETSFRSRRPAA